jgi:UDPglucose 6-dehydrogenase
LAFKPNTDDVRFAPSITLVKLLLGEGAEIRAYDPQAMEKAKSELPNVTYRSSPYQAAEGADAILIVTEWDEFGQLDWDRLLATVEQPLIVDGRNVFASEDISRKGFRYVSIGRVDASPCQPVVGEKIESPSSRAGSIREVSA